MTGFDAKSWGGEEHCCADSMLKFDFSTMTLFPLPTFVVAPFAEGFVRRPWPSIIKDDLPASAVTRRQRHTNRTDRPLRDILLSR